MSAPPCRRRAIYAQEKASEPEKPEAFFIALPVLEMTEPKKKRGRPRKGQSK
jgi:hypothetical protein